MIVQQRDAVWWFKLNGALRHAIVNGAANPLGKSIVITEYPKSGGTWLSQMLAATLEIPYPRNRLPHPRKQIIHGCYRRTHPQLETIVVWRDGRDAMVSFYYHLMFDKPITSRKFSQRLQTTLNIEDPRDIKNNLPRFIDWTFSGGYPGYSWADFVQLWHRKAPSIFTSYEKVSADPLAELERVLSALDRSDVSRDRLEEIVHEFSFENQTSRKRGEEDVTHFVRKGIVGDWVNAFTPEARKLFARYAGKELIMLGYEQDDRWVLDDTG